MKQHIGVQGMSCNHCTSRLEKGLLSLDGVNEANVSLENQEASVSFDESKLGLNDLIQKIEDLGFTTTL